MNSTLLDTSKLIVKVITSTGSGSGFYLKKHKIVVTNQHVISGSTKAVVEWPNRTRMLAPIVYADIGDDIAFLSLDADLQLPDANLDHGVQVKTGMRATVIGFPLGRPMSITEGIVSATKQVLSGREYIQTDAAVNPGNSGGPLVDENGNVLGITSCKFDKAENISFAIPLEKLKQALKYFEGNEKRVYCVKCAACPQLFFEKTTYCPRCGQKVNTDAYFTLAPLSSLAVFVEEAIRSAQFDPEITRNGYENWQLYNRKALITIFVTDKRYLLVTAPLTTIPEEKLPEFYRYLFTDPVKPSTLNTDFRNSQISLNYLVALTDTENKDHRATIQANIANAITRAASLQQELIEHYGCEVSVKARIPE